MDQNTQPISQAWMSEMGTRRPALVAKMFEVFLIEEPQRLADIRAALDQGDAERLRFLVHSLKGAAAALGAERLRDCCLALEMAAKSGDLSLAPARFADLGTEMERVFTFMRAHQAAA